MNLTVDMDINLRPEETQSNVYTAIQKEIFFVLLEKIFRQISKLSEFFLVCLTFMQHLFSPPTQLDTLGENNNRAQPLQFVGSNRSTWPHTSGSILVQKL